MNSWQFLGAIDACLQVFQDVHNYQNVRPSIDLTEDSTADLKNLLSAQGKGTALHACTICFKEECQEPRAPMILPHKSMNRNSSPWILCTHTQKNVTLYFLRKLYVSSSQRRYAMQQPHAVSISSNSEEHFYVLAFGVRKLQPRPNWGLGAPFSESRQCDLPDCQRPC